MKFKLYPNPAKNEIILRLEGFEKNSYVQVEIFDTNSRKIESKSGIGGRNLVFDLKHYPSGNYLLKAAQGSKVTSVKFIKE